VLIGRNLEDSITWVDSSKIKRNIMKYSDKVWSDRRGLISSLMTSICYRFEVLTLGALNGCISMINQVYSRIQAEVL
jgi:hypothetical protein